MKKRTINVNTRVFVDKRTFHVMIRVRWLQNKEKQEAAFTLYCCAEPGKWDSERQRAQRGTVHSIHGSTISAKMINEEIDKQLDSISDLFTEFELWQLS